MCVVFNSCFNIILTSILLDMGDSLYLRGQFVRAAFDYARTPHRPLDHCVNPTAKNDSKDCISKEVLIPPLSSRYTCHHGKVL